MGLERVAYLLQGVDNLYEIDEVFPVHRAGRRAGRQDATAPTTTTTSGCGWSPTTSAPALMLIGDGVTPGNEGRGYVLRRLLRRVVRSMRLLGVDDAELPELLPVSRDAMKRSPTPSSRPTSPGSPTIAYAEEEAFRRTLTAGTHDLRHRGRAGQDGGHRRRCPATRRSSCTTPTASRSTSPWRWRPSRALAVDEAGFRALMQEQRDRAKADAKAKKAGARRHRGLPRAARAGRDPVHRLRRR